MNKSLVSRVRESLYVQQLMQRFNEAIALDYMIPFRIIGPGDRRCTPARMTKSGKA